MHQINGLCTQLIEVSEGDASAIVQLRNNPKYNQFLSSQQAITLSMQVDWIKHNKQLGNNINFKITDTQAGFKGTISLYNIDGQAAEFGRFIATASLYAVEAEYLLLKFGFEQLGLERIYCKTLLSNAKVWQMHRHFGFQDLGKEIDSRLQQSVFVQALTQVQYSQFDYTRIHALIARFQKTLPL